MNTKLLDTIKEKYKNRDVSELINIYKENDRYNYSDEAFESIKIILQEKNIPIPIQDEPKIKETEKVFSPAFLERKRNGYIGMILGLSIIIFSKTINLTNEPTPNDDIIILGFYILGIIFWFWGFYNYVKRKGYSDINTLIGLLGLLGLLIMYLREDRGEGRYKYIIIICNACKTEKHVTDEDIKESYFICKICGEKNIW